jgi:hypothetical protein
MDYVDVAVLDSQLGVETEVTREIEEQKELFSRGFVALVWQTNQGQSRGESNKRTEPLYPGEK